MADTGAVIVPTKRRNPFGERQLAELPASDALSAADTTQEMLMEAQKNLPPLPPPASPEHGECFMCRVYDTLVTCEFCERKSCQAHSKLCHQCAGVFCGLCSVTDYKLRYSDSSICLSCQEDRRKADLPGSVQFSRPHATVVHRMKTGSVDGRQQGRTEFQSAPFGSKQVSQ